jgi:hypothetical protein
MFDFYFKMDNFGKVEEEALDSFDVLEFVAVVFFMIASGLPSFDGNYYLEM